MKDSLRASSSPLLSRRWPWLAAGLLFLASAAATAWSTYLHWLPCRGSMLDGSILRGYSSDTSFSDACLRRMDTNLPFPSLPEPAEQTAWASELGAVAMALCGLAWLSLVLGLKLPRGAKLIAVLPAAPTLVMAVLSAWAVLGTGRSFEAYFPVWLWVSVEVAAIAMLITLGQRHLELLGPPFVRPAIVLWAATAFGMFHAVLEYAGMSFFNSANWDSPPGTGAITVLVLLAGAVAAGTLVVHSPPPADEPGPDQPPSTINASRCTTTRS